MKSYTSEVSPDRKGIITSGLKAVSGNRQTVIKPIDFVATLLEGKVKYQKLPSGNSMIYNEAWGNAKRGIPLAGEDAMGVENPQNSFNAKA